MTFIPLLIGMIIGIAIPIIFVSIISINEEDDEYDYDYYENKIDEELRKEEEDSDEIL
jgi:hypothetical protein